MARYKAEANLFIDDPVTKGGRYVRAGQLFDSNDPPGKHWLPQDDEAKSLVERRPRAALTSREAALNAARDTREKDKKARADAERDRKAVENTARATGLKGRKEG